MSAVAADALTPEGYRDLALRLDHDRTELFQSMRVLAQPIRAVDRGRALLLQMQRVVPRTVLLIGAAVLLVLASRRLPLRGLLTVGLEVWRAWPTLRRVLSELKA